MDMSVVRSTSMEQLIADYWADLIEGRPIALAGVSVGNKLLRLRKIRQRVASKINVMSNKKYEVFTASGNDATYHTARTLKLAISKANKAASKSLGDRVSIWSPYRGHVYQVRANPITKELEVLHGAEPSVDQADEESSKAPEISEAQSVAS